MQKAMYPCKNIRITQTDHEGTHADCWAVDNAGADGEIEEVIAPFTGILKKVYRTDANEVWLESIDPVEYPDGTIDYMTIMFAHANDISNLSEGQEINQGQVFYSEGTKGKAYGNHVHFECGKGKFTGSGWHQDSTGAWSINNGKKVTECLFVDDTYKIYDTRGYTFARVQQYFGKTVERDTTKNQIQILDGMTSVRARNNPNGDILGYMNTGIYNSIEVVEEAGYKWHKVDEGLWFAEGEWSEYLPKTENQEMTNFIEQLQEGLAGKNEVINSLTAEITELTNTIIDKDKEIAALKEQLANAPKFIFESTKLDYYAIELNENQKLYLG